MSDENIILLLDKIEVQLREGLKAVKLAKRVLEGDQLPDLTNVFDRLFNATLAEAPGENFLRQTDLMSHVCSELITNAALAPLANELRDLGWTPKPQNALYIRFLDYLRDRLRYVKSAYPRFYGVETVHLSSDEEYAAYMAEFDQFDK